MEVPQLTDAKKGKGKKRPAEDAEPSLEDLIAKSAADDSKLSKKQAKKLKNNQGDAVAAQEDKDSKDKKRVQFAKTLEQGPTGSAVKDAAAKDGKGKLGVKVVQGVTIDDRKLGSGRVVKNGDRVGMRYIGKLESGKVFDCKCTSPKISMTRSDVFVLTMRSPIFSQQEGRSVLVPSRQGRGHPRLGHWHCRHVHWRRASPDHPGLARVRLQEARRHPAEQHSDLRR